MKLGKMNPGLTMSKADFFGKLSVFFSWLFFQTLFGTMLPRHHMWKVLGKDTVRVVVPTIHKRCFSLHVSFQGHGCCREVKVSSITLLAAWDEAVSQAKTVCRARGYKNCCARRTCSL